MSSWHGEKDETCPISTGGGRGGAQTSSRIRTAAELLMRGCRPCLDAEPGTRTPLRRPSPSASARKRPSGDAARRGLARPRAGLLRVALSGRDPSPTRARRTGAALGGASKCSTSSARSADDCRSSTTSSSSPPEAREARGRGADGVPARSRRWELQGAIALLRAAESCAPGIPAGLARARPAAPLSLSPALLPFAIANPAIATKVINLMCEIDHSTLKIPKEGEHNPRLSACCPGNQSETLRYPQARCGSSFEETQPRLGPRIRP